jgi:hypothetical protein
MGLVQRLVGGAGDLGSASAEALAGDSLVASATPSLALTRCHSVQGVPVLVRLLLSRSKRKGTGIVQNCAIEVRARTVCETAGVIAPTLYHHFGDKDGLLRIDFAIQRPRLFRLMVESTRSDPSTSQEAFVLMRGIIERLATQGRLVTDVETTARTVWAASNGVLTLFMRGAVAKDINLVRYLGICLLRSSGRR